MVQEGRQRGYEMFGVDNFYGNGINVTTLPPYIHLLGTKGGIPYPTNFFDACISNQVVEHIKNIDMAVSEMWRVLKQDGIMLHIFPTYV